jgi:hypothetical protein
MEIALCYRFSAQKPDESVVLIDSNPARAAANAAEMHGFVKHVALRDPLEAGYRSEALGR